MKLIANANDLSIALNQVIKATSTKTTNPILEGILLKASAGTLTMVATDLEIAIERTLQADVKVEGETVVAGRLFTDFMRKIDSEQVELTLLEGKLKIKYGDNESFLQVFNANDFPPVAELTEAQTFSIVRKELKDLINKIKFSVCLDDSRPILKGALLEVSDITLTGVALDGYRLAKCTKAIEKTTAMMSAIVPSRALVEIANLLDDTEDLVEVGVQKNYILVSLEHTKLTARLLDGEFINYRQIIPTEFTSTVNVPKDIFESSIERALLLAKAEKTYLVKFDIKDDMMYITSNSEMGTISEQVPVKLSGKDMSIAFNARFFLDLLKPTNVDHIQIKMNEQTQPGIVVPSGAVEDEFLYLILPVRIMN